MEYMDKDKFLRKWSETHTELQVIDKMSKKDMQRFDNTKKLAEKMGADERIEKLSEFLTDAVSVRKKEVLNKEDLPMKDLLMLAIKAHPQRAKIENTGSVNFTFADMIERTTFSLTRADNIDVEVADEE